MSDFYLGEKSLSNLVGVYPESAFVVMEAIKITDVDFSVVDGVRTREEQVVMVETGVSWTMDSYHLYGLAIDLVPWINNQSRWELEPSRKVVSAVKEVIATHGINSFDNGYDLWEKDIFHWQKTGYKTKYDIRILDRC